MRFPQFAFSQHGFHARQIFARNAKLGYGFGLPRSDLKAQAKHLLGEFLFARLQLAGILIVQFLGSPRHQRLPARLTKRV
jgi:hypothetical protein